MGLKGLIMGLRGALEGGRTYGQTDAWTDVWKFTPVYYRTSALWGTVQRSIDLHFEWVKKKSSRRGTQFFFKKTRPLTASDGTLFLPYSSHITT